LTNILDIHLLEKKVAARGVAPAQCHTLLKAVVAEQLIYEEDRL
jgi:hypothetical protein